MLCKEIFDIVSSTISKPAREMADDLMMFLAFASMRSLASIFMVS